jgi:hypothetical protein
LKSGVDVRTSLVVHEEFIVRSKNVPEEPGNTFWAIHGDTFSYTSGNLITDQSGFDDIEIHAFMSC